MPQPLTRHRETASQTGGPYVHIGCIPTFAGLEGVYPEDLGKRAIEEGAKGEIIEISGEVFDGTGWALRDAMIESWQADAEGRYPGQEGADPKVNGFCRFAADKDTGLFTLRTVKPGRAGGQAPHIALWIAARGINVGLQTRIYFDDEDNAGDPVLSRIEQKNRASTLIAKKDGASRYRFDIKLQGEGETVFLDM
ncbi:protocatechuate 3,4-dioxygenase subunit alpha [Silicimonas algicola]|uniref:Protocatechuate 3,4-dioxygenase alpha subunit n=1 Tax=Silicimonas algicola TaxID=1826607 RepID=A0A316G652_9RHOB|nr:protocatechuate 3,4-dioxygenase subunit alpha [Silicimonas algicola]AZQ68797.1 protocatechuate 3,4-dioxygenase subunit alpha [Silicimonas algicola]PWK56123.1 protocatechuate 3,4-dioxygenase alpha subunit [Silicimonas algicola]